MKPYLPHNLLLALTVVVTGFCVLYNFVIRESFASTIQYAYPAVEKAAEPVSLPVAEGYDPVPGQEETAPPQSREPEDPGITSVRFPLDINRATVEELKFIPQVGDVTAQRITQYRDHLGGYTDLEQLRDIKGVGDKTYEHLYTYLIVSEDTLMEEEPEESSSPEPEAAGSEEEEQGEWYPFS